LSRESRRCRQPAIYDPRFIRETPLIPGREIKGKAGVNIGAFPIIEIAKASVSTPTLIHVQIQALNLSAASLSRVIARVIGAAILARCQNRAEAPGLLKSREVQGPFFPFTASAWDNNASCYRINPE